MAGIVEFSSDFVPLEYHYLGDGKEQRPVGQGKGGRDASTRVQRDMIRDDNELTVTQERVSYFLGLLSQFRVTARPEEFPALASGYRAEVERMQSEILDYLTRHVTQTTPAKTG